MNKKTIIPLLIGVVVLLGVLVFVSNLPGREEGTEDGGALSGGEMASETAIYSASYDSLTKITLHYDTDSYTFIKDGAMWLCESHPDEKFNMSKLGSLATRLASVKCTDAIAGDEINPADCGIDLQKPAISFECDLGTVSLYQGNELASYEGYYLMTSLSSDVYVISAQTNSLLFEEAGEYKNESIKKIDYEKISAIEFNNENCSFSLRLGKSDLKAGVPYEWSMISPVELMARDTEVKEMLIDPVSSISGKMYVSDKGDFENYSLSDRNNYIIFTDSNGESQRVYFSPEIGGKCYMSIDESKYIYEAKSEGSSYAKIRLIDIVSRYIYTNLQSNIKEIIIKGEEADYTLDFTASPDIIVNGNKITDSGECNEVFYAVCAVLADDINTEPMGETDLTMTYRLHNGEVITLAFAQQDARYYKVSVDSKPTYTILKSKFDKSLETLEKYAK